MSSPAIVVRHTGASLELVFVVTRRYLLALARERGIPLTRAQARWLARSCR